MHKLYNDLVKNEKLLDVRPLFRWDQAFNATLELADCFSVLFRLFGLPIPRISSQTGVAFHIPDGHSVPGYFSRLSADPVSDPFADLDVIFFAAKPVILGPIPETLGPFSLYVVLHRRSKDDPHLCFRDSRGWLSIRGRDIETAASFPQDNVTFIGYIRDLECTNCFRNRLSGNHLKRNPRARSLSPSARDHVLQGTPGMLSLSRSYPEMPTYLHRHELRIEASFARRVRSGPSGPRTVSLPDLDAPLQKQLRDRGRRHCRLTNCPMPECLTTTVVLPIPPRSLMPWISTSVSPSVPAEIDRLALLSVTTVK
jgi:hypothetical protein